MTLFTRTAGPQAGSPRLLGLSWLAGVILLASLVAAGWGLVREHRLSRNSERDHALIVETERLLSALKDVETGQRGFIITGKEQYLEPYHWGLDAVGPALHAVAALGQADTSDLSRSVADRLAEAAQGIATYRTDGPEAGAARIQTGTGKALMDRVRVEIARQQTLAEQRLMALRQENQLNDLLRIASVAGLVLASTALALVALRRRREQRASQALLKGVLDNAPIGLGFIDRASRVRQVNRALARMSGRSLDAIPGTDVWEVVPQFKPALQPTLDRMLRGSPQATTVDFETPTPDGLATHFEASLYPLRQEGRSDASGGFGMVIADVTPRKRAEQSTKESEERLRTLIEATAAIIWTADPTGAFVKPQPYWSRFTGQTPEASLGWGRLDHVHPDDLDPTKEAWKAGVASRAPIILEYRLKRADGEWRHMALSAAPVLMEDGSIREWVGSHTDITARKDAELMLSAAKHAAEAANRAKSSFLANMSHELRTPLSAVIGYSEMLEEEVEDLGDTTILTDLGKIKSNARHLLSLINDVLDLSKIEANKMDVYAETIAIEPFIQEVASTVQALIAKKSNTLELALGPNLGQMRTDVVKLRQCLFNLLSNAAKFTENGRIELRVRREARAGGDWIGFDVTDSGIGMTPDQLHRLFQRFVQADETTTRRFGGTGLGLALSRGFARLLGGDITVDSTEGRGTCFTMLVPATVPMRQPDDELEAIDVEVPPPSTPRELVLVIDDEASQRDLMSRFLERQRFDVRTAGDGLSGLALARSLRPRAILLDIMMPHMDGWSVLKALKADPDLARIPVVLVTFVADAGLGSALGAVDHLAKPIDWKRLKSVMDRFREADGDVLVVDDDEDMRARLRTVLERDGWTVKEAGNGEEALAHIKLATPRVILLDLTMPVMDGFAFLNQLRVTPGREDTPVVVLSARDITANERAALVEADRILSKGNTSMQELKTEIRALGDRSRTGSTT